MAKWILASVHSRGGITPIRKFMSLAEAKGMTVEVQCWGYTLTQAANLHVMLAFGNCDYFEQPVPYPSFEYGSNNVMRTDKEGFVHAPNGSGWASMLLGKPSRRRHS